MSTWRFAATYERGGRHHLLPGFFTGSRERAITSVIATGASRRPVTITSQLTAIANVFRDRRRRMSLIITVIRLMRNNAAHDASALLDFPDFTGPSFFLPRAPTAPLLCATQGAAVVVSRSVMQLTRSGDVCARSIDRLFRRGLAPPLENPTRDPYSSASPPWRRVTWRVGEVRCVSAQTSMRRRRRVQKGPSHRTPHPESQPHPSPPHHHRKLTPPRRSPPPGVYLDVYVGIAEWRGSDTVAAHKRRKRDRSTSRRMAGVSYVSTYVPSAVA